MIIGDPYQIAIHIEQIDVLCSPSGMFNFIINDTLVPGKGVTMDLYMVISELKESLEDGMRKNLRDVGNIPLSDLDFSEGEPENFISLSSELSDYGFIFWLGFDGDEDRLIYTTNYEKTFQEERYPRGTIEKLIKDLPLAEDLVMKKTGAFINTELKS
ncbi:Imm42 family immunity protein [Photorhabdus bodei]|uniref:Imm42 family immunity protein n=1 Tax=Photorhabdus bodei TaxID=2029681 RepID=A0AAW6BT13_9GAMM|nr:Imm42 family immunity protein [Photorhabdus bodei]MDB6375139.1 Imm42 family immunity protein [Photorhabdus bodei]